MKNIQDWMVDPIIVLDDLTTCQKIVSHHSHINDCALLILLLVNKVSVHLLCLFGAILPISQLPGRHEGSCQWEQG